MPAPSAKHVLLYDRDCGFCMRSLRLVLAWDRRGLLRAVSIQSDQGQRLLAPVAPGRRLDSWHLVSPAGEIHSAGAAAAPLADLLPGGRPLAALARRFPRATERAYRWVASNRGRLGRLLQLPLLAVVALAGCGGGGGAEGEASASPQLKIYVSMPLRGAAARNGQAVVNGAKLALAEAGGEAGGLEVDAVYLDSTGGSDAAANWDPVVVAENARTATRDASTIAYIGEFDSEATKTSLPITNQAGILHVSPASTSPDLVSDPPGSAGPEYQPSGRRNFGRVIPATERGRAPSKPPPPEDSFVKRYEDDYGARPSAYAAYGYEAMAVVLDSIDRASDPGDRTAVIDAFFATSDRDSILGPYSIDQLGNTTLKPSA